MSKDIVNLVQMILNHRKGKGEEMIELPEENYRYSSNSYHAQLSYTDCQKDMLKLFVEWGNGKCEWKETRRLECGHCWGTLEDKLTELEGK